MREFERTWLKLDLRMLQKLEHTKSERFPPCVVASVAFASEMACPSRFQGARGASSVRLFVRAQSTSPPGPNRHGRRASARRRGGQHCIAIICLARYDIRKHTTLYTRVGHTDRLHGLRRDEAL